MKMKWLSIGILLVLGVTSLFAQADTSDTGQPLPSAEIAVVKSVSNDNGATWSDAQLAPGLVVAQGDPLLYLVQIVNIGDFAVTDLAIADTLLETNSCVMPQTLEPAQLVECIVGPLTAAAGETVNTVLVTAQYGDETITATDSAYVYAGAVALLSVEKLVGLGGAWYAADNPPGFSVPAAGELRFRITVTNEGTYTFTNITLTDSMTTLADCEIPLELAPGLSFQCSTRRIEVAMGAQVNVATVTAVANGQTYSATDAAHFVAAHDVDIDVVVIEGPIVSIEGNVIVVAGRNIVLRMDDPMLTVIRIGDVIRVEGNDGDNNVINAYFIIIIDTDVYVGDEPDDIYRDDRNCGNPPPPWAPAHGWRNKCQLVDVTQGALPPGLREKDKNKNNNGRGNGPGNNGRGNGNGNGSKGNGNK